MRRMSARSCLVPVVVASLLVAGCGGGPVSEATVLDVTPTSAPTASATLPPTPAAWIAPEADARVDATTVDLAATVTPPSGSTIAGVEFLARWDGGGEAQACVAASSGEATWGCEADLLASGVPVGPITFELRATDAGGGPIGTTAGPRPVTYAVEPPKPADPTFALVRRTPHDDGTVTAEYRITWTAPAGYATQFFAYGLGECLRYAKKYDEKPCVVRGMPIPRAKLKLIGTAPGDARELTVSWELGEIEVPPYAAVLLRATNDYGDSIFTIVHSENVCFQCVY
jgi:hypothetical protein